jgi:hypothetical protein
VPHEQLKMVADAVGEENTLVVITEVRLTL